MPEPSLPVVAIVGRPNVGKSSLFNAILRKRVSIEEPTAGVTRDRISAFVTHKGRSFELLDTGGIGIEDAMGLSKEVERQIRFAIESADVLVLVVDVKEGVTPLDSEVARRLRKVDVPIVLVANKCDSPNDGLTESDIGGLGFGRPIPTSAKERYGRQDLMDAIVERLPEGSGVVPPEIPAMKLAVVGKRNAGKSTLINALVGEERVIVSEIPGTTRDSVDVVFEFEGQRLMAIDTAGVRRRRSIESSIELFSLDRARKSILRADVVVLLFDAREEISVVEKQLAAEIVDGHKPCILAVNKWDLAQRASTEKYADYIYAHLTGVSFAPICFISAMTGFNVSEMIRLALELHGQAGTRIGTGELNRVMDAIFAERSPRARGSREPKLYYATQVGVHPPSFVLFVNEPRLFDEEYLRYVQGSLRSRFNFPEIPVRLLLKSSR